jgi:hypothetical protein
LLLLAPVPELPEATAMALLASTAVVLVASNPKSKVAGKGTMGLGGAFAKCMKALATIATGGALACADSKLTSPIAYPKKVKTKFQNVTLTTINSQSKYLSQLPPRQVH